MEQSSQHFLEIMNNDSESKHWINEMVHEVREHKMWVYEKKGSGLLDIHFHEIYSTTELKK